MKKITIKIDKEEFKKKLGIEDGKDADETKIVEDVLSKIPALIPPTEIPSESPEILRDKLEVLKGDERLDKSAIKGLENFEKDLSEIKARKISIKGGAKGIGLYVDGAKKLLTAQTINLIGGTGVSLTYSYAYGRNDITISVSSASISLITVTGTIDDSNVDFVAASTPQLVVVNGASYRDGKGCTIIGTAITLDNPVGTGGDIYCLG